MENKPYYKQKNPTNASIEAQVAIKALTELKIAKVEIPMDLEYALWWWMRDVLHPYLGILTGTKEGKDE